MQDTEREVTELALLAGQILLENGAEISRVEETMDRICRHYGIQSWQAFVLTNGIFATAGGREASVFAKVKHIPVGSPHLDKVAAVNQLSREISEGHYTVGDAKKELDRIQRMPEKSPLMQILASAVGSAAFCFLFGGSAKDAAAAFLAGFLLYLYVLWVSRPHLSKIVGNIGGGALVTLAGGVLFRLGLGEHLNSIIIGSVMPLVPGLAFTNAIRDVADGDYISGSVRMLDALLIFFCIAIGVGLGIALLHLGRGGMQL